jgi:nicotinate phosphoribosyltransferase
MSFDGEQEAFEAYAQAMPNNSVFLVDTYDTLEGVRSAVAVGHWLRAHGHEMIGVRLDSGDLAYLSKEARRILDQAGFPKATIVASNDLDEHVIASLKQQGAAIGVWGVGTRLVTGHDQCALGGVYKLAAVREPGEQWQYKVKLSEQAVKVSNPGLQQVRRYSSAEGFVGDVIYDEERGIPSGSVMVDPGDLTRRKRLPLGSHSTELLVPILRGGQIVYTPPALEAVRRQAQEQLATFHAGIKRALNPHQYPVGLEEGLFDLRNRLILGRRGFAA